MGKQDRGFASMKAAHAKGRAHEWTTEEAREAGRKGGSAPHRESSAAEAAATPAGEP